MQNLCEKAGKTRFWRISCKNWPLFMKTISLLKFWNEVHVLLFIFPEVCEHEKYCGFLLTNFSVDCLKVFCCITWQQYFSGLSELCRKAPRSCDCNFVFTYWIQNSQYGPPLGLLWMLREVFLCVNFICLSFSWGVLDGCIDVISTVLYACLIFVVVGSLTLYFVPCVRTY